MSEEIAMSTQKIAVISGSRAEAGLLLGVMQVIKNHPELKLQVFVTGMHLSDTYGSTWQEFPQNHITITDKIPLDLGNSDALSNSIAIGQGIGLFSQSFNIHKPDLILVLGDRFEILAAVQAAMMLNIPIAHMHGGELSLGSLDDRIRHAISKIAQLHFPANQQYAKRLIQMGELPERVFNVGATAIDNIKKIKLFDKPTLEKSLGLNLKHPLLLTWHPETVEQHSTLHSLKEILYALEKFSEHQIIITKANADTGGYEINQYLDQYVLKRPNYHLFTSLGNQRYLSLLQFTQVVLGNSSSALLEVAAMRVPSINIGQRQDGRYKPDSVIDCAAKHKEIISALHTANSDKHKKKCQEMDLPYGDGHCAEKIVNIIAQTNLKALSYKPFYNIDFTIK